MIEKYILHQQGFTDAGLLGGFIQQYKFLDDNDDIPRKYKVWNGCKQHVIVADGTTNKNFSQFYRRAGGKLLFNLVRTTLYSTNRGYQFEPHLTIFQYLSKE